MNGSDSRILAKHGIDFVDAAKIFDGPILEFPQGRRNYGKIGLRL
jgi:uncharacterized DUF497 family protein